MKHAKHGPSSAARWLRCPASINSPSIAGKAAEAGTLRHEIMEKWVEGSLTAGWPLTGIPGGVDPTAWADTKLCREYLEKHPVFQGALEGRPGFAVRAEQTVHWGAPFGLKDPEDYYGTVDVILSGPEVYEILDFKFGWVPVEAKRNFQLYLYQNGAISNPRIPFTPGAKIRHTILQPNAGGVKIWEPIDADLRSMELEVRQGLALPANHRVAGDHCERGYCGFRGDCVVHLKWVGGKTENLFKPVTDMPDNPNTPEQFTMDDLLGLPPNTLQPEPPSPLVDVIEGFIERFTGADRDAISPAEAAQLLDLADIVVPLFSNIQEVWRDKAIKGTNVPGWKLVPGRTSRVWADDDETILKRLAAWKIKKAEATTTKVVTPAQAEKLFNPRLGERQQRNMQKWIEVKKGRPLLVREEDPRKALKTVKFEPVTVKPEDVL